MKKRIITQSPEATQRLAETLTSGLRGDELFAFTGDLGSGKTTFIQGLGKGLGAKTAVTSPTFVLQRIYRGKKHVLFHYDFYRLTEEEIYDLDLREVLGKGVIAIEWAEKLPLLPPGSIKVKIREKGADKREFIFEFPPERDYLFSKR